MMEVLLLGVAQKLHDILIAELPIQRVAKFGFVLTLVACQRSVED